MIRRSILKGLAVMVLPGTGGQSPRPLNAPAGHGAVPGIQPGVSSPIVVARQVRVFINASQSLVINANGIQFIDGTATSDIFQGSPNQITINSGGAAPAQIQVSGNPSSIVLGASAVQLVLGGSTIPLAHLSQFPVSGAATLATTIAALNALYAALVSAQVFAS